MSIEFRAIRPEEREECLRLWCTVWPGDGSEAYFRRYFYGDVEWLPYYTQVAVEDGRLVSAVQICKRVVACGDYRLTMGGIANVSTLPEARGKGYNTACLQRAVAIMEADAMDFSLLFTGINGYYARQGFATLPLPWLEGRIRSDFTPQPTPYTVRPALPGDVAAIRSLYDEYNQQRPLAVQRNEAYWRDWTGLSAQNVSASLRVAVASDGEIVGYLKSGTFSSAVPYSEEGKDVSLNEFGTRLNDDQEPVARALLESAAAEALAHGGKSLKIEVALTPVVRRVADEIAPAMEAHHGTSGMARLLHRTNLLQSFAMLWNDRWIAAGRPAGALAFDTPYGPVQLDANGVFLRVVETDEARDRMSQATFFQLLFGLITAEQATADAEVHSLLTALFPLQAAVYWGADGF